MRARVRRLPPYLLVFFAFCLPVAVWLFWEAWEKARLAGASVETSCTVIGTHTEVHTSSDGVGVTYTPTITIAHEVGGRRYQRTDVGEDDNIDSSLYRSLGNPIAGQIIPCWYVADRPELVIAFRERGSPGWPLFTGLLLLAVPFGFVIYELRKPAGSGKRRAH